MVVSEQTRRRLLSAAAVCFLLVGCGGDAVPAGGSSEDSEQAAQPTAAATSEATAAPSEEGPPELGGDPSAEAAPGVYQSDDPPVTLTVPPPSGGLRWFGLGDPGFLLLRLSTDPCDGCEVGGIVVSPVDGDVQSATKEWQDLKPSSLSKPKPVKLGGASGVTFRGEVSPKPGVSVVHGGLNPNGSVVVYVLDVDGQTIVLYEEYRPGKHAKTFLAEADKIVKSMRFKV